MARWSKDHATRSISIGPAIAAGQPNENAGLTPKNPGTTNGPGDEFAYVPYGRGGFRYPATIAWDIVVTGGTFTVLNIALEESDDGLNWNVIDTSASLTGGRKVVSPNLGRYIRANITLFTANTGTPVVQVGITY